MLVFSFVLVASTYGKWVNDPVFLIVFPLAAILLALTVVNIILVAKNVKRKGFYYANSITQVPILFLFAGLLGVLGLVFIVLDIAVLVTLPEKKTPEELLRHPPVPITRNYRILLGIGLSAMLISIFIPWLSTSDATLSLFGIYSGIATHSNLPAFSVSQTAVIFALLTLFLSPVSLVCGGLGMIRRRFSLVSGIFAILAGSSIMIVLTKSIGPGAYGFILGGILVLVGYFGFRRAR